jgi:hypothetical protein
MPEGYYQIVSNRGECIRLLVAAGFSREELADIQARDQVHGVACGIVAHLQFYANNKWEMPRGDPFMALAQMAPEKKKWLRAAANGSFDDLTLEED